MKNLLMQFFKTSTMSKMEFALRIGVSRSAVCRWVNYEYMPHPGHAKKIQRLTKGKVPVSYWGYICTPSGSLIRISKKPLELKDFVTNLEDEENL